MSSNFVLLFFLSLCLVFDSLYLSYFGICYIYTRTSLKTSLYIYRMSDFWFASACFVTLVTHIFWETHSKGLLQLSWVSAISAMPFSFCYMYTKYIVWLILQYRRCIFWSGFLDASFSNKSQPTRWSLINCAVKIWKFSPTYWHWQTTVFEYLCLRAHISEIWRL